MRAYRDPKLPYQFHECDKPAPAPMSPAVDEPDAIPLIELPIVKMREDLEARAQEASGMVRMSTLHRLGRTLTTAHRKDYERKTRTVEEEGDIEEDKEEEVEEVEEEVEEEHDCEAAGQGACLHL